MQTSPACSILPAPGAYKTMLKCAFWLSSTGFSWQSASSALTGRGELAGWTAPIQVQAVAQPQADPAAPLPQEVPGHQTLSGLSSWLTLSSILFVSEGFWPGTIEQLGSGPSPGFLPTLLTTFTGLQYWLHSGPESPCSSPSAQGPSFLGFRQCHYEAPSRGLREQAQLAQITTLLGLSSPVEAQP